MAWMAAAIAMVASLPVSMAAQETTTHATRADLERMAVEAERLSTSGPADARERKRAEAATLRERLRSGDFHVGDRIVVRVMSDSSLTDTFVVHTGRVLQLGNLVEVPLEGVLRSELQAHLTAQVARYLRDPRVQATSLIRLAVLGEVTRPGYFAMSADVLMSDAIMLAGGPTTSADVDRITIRRGTSDLLKPDEVRAAMVQGRTLDQLNLRAGDEIVVGERKRRSLSGSIQVMTGLVAVVVGVLAASR